MYEQNLANGMFLYTMLATTIVHDLFLSPSSSYLSLSLLQFTEVM